MKSPLTLIAAAMAFAMACNPSSNDNSDSTAAASEAAEARPANVILWTELGLRENPDDGKFVTTAYIGEHFEVTGDSATKVVGGKTQNYHKIKLTDGKVGWVRDEFIALNVIPAAVVNGADVYKRPDITTIIPKTFNSGDYLVIRKDEGEFAEVIGKISGDKWFTSGYVLSKEISVMNIDVRFAALLQRAREEKKEEVAQMLFTQSQNADVFGESQIWKLFYGPMEEGAEAGGYEEGLDEGEGEEEDPGFGIMQLPLGEPLEGLMAHYLMDHIEMLDNSGNKQDGQSFNTGFDHDKAGSAMSALTFNGASSYGTINWKGEPIKPPFTVVAYAKLGDLSRRDQTIVSKGRSKDGTGFNFGYTVNENSQGIYYFGLIGAERPVSATAIASEPAGDWVYLAASFDMKAMKLYVNGELAATVPVSDEDADVIYQNLANSAQPLEIGRELASLGRYFKGSIDHVALWNRALTDEEVADMNH